MIAGKSSEGRFKTFMADKAVPLMPERLLALIEATRSGNLRYWLQDLTLVGRVNEKLEKDQVFDLICEAFGHLKSGNKECKARNLGLI